MKKIKKFLKDYQWVILALIGAATWIVFCLEIYVSAMEVIDFYVTHALL